jgi:hypothetical protein
MICYAACKKKAVSQLFHAGEAGYGGRTLTAQETFGPKQQPQRKLSSSQLICGKEKDVRWMDMLHNDGYKPCATVVKKNADVTASA